MTDEIALPAAGHADQRLGLKLAMTAGLAALADVLFYGQRLGLSVALFAVALIGGTHATNRMPSDRRRIVQAGLILVAGIIPVVEELNTLSFLLLALAMLIVTALLTRPEAIGLWTPLSALRQLLLIGPIRFVPEAAGAWRGPSFTRGLVVWFVPLAFGSLFVLLFASANPVIEEWLDAIKPGATASQINWQRALFWVAALSLVWPFISVRWRNRKARPDAPKLTVPEPDAIPSEFDILFSLPTILRSLILFNLLFAVESVLDIVYLWAGAALPGGISYAAYAHRGAYPLVITALLAAGFVLIAIRPGATTAGPKLVCALLYLWIGQNVMLVLSSILRLKLYMDIYLLTYWRLAALIWMGLVAAGLVLIVIRVARNHSHLWLIRMNLLAALATLYVCSLTNFDAIIADYNVAHSWEAGGRGATIDDPYLVSLGPQTLPALQKTIMLRKTDYLLVASCDRLREAQGRDIASWRSWGFRSHRLQRYLDTHPVCSASG
jgi:hypothetical protein